MKELKFIIYSILSVLTLNSCLSTKELIKGDSILENNINALNGIYENVAVGIDNPKSNQSLYLLLFKNYHRQNPYYNKDEDSEGKIRIKVISDRKIEVDYILEGCTKKSKTYKGEMKKNFFVIKRKWRIFGIPILFGVYDESKLAIGINENGYLHIKKGFYNIGGMIGMANSNELYYNYFYEKRDSLMSDNSILPK